MPVAEGSESVDFSGERSLGRRVSSRARREILARRLTLINRLTSRQATRTGGPTVTVTSYGARLERVYLALEAIANGTLQPGRLFLWLEESDVKRVRAIPELGRLIARGVEVLSSPNLGPHTKYYPYVASELYDDRSPFITADDDVLYPRDWLQVLAEAEDDGGIVAHRAHVVTFDGTAVASYHDWLPCTSSSPSLRNFATGVSGVRYPPGFGRLLAERGTDFLRDCPRADDVWLHATAVRNAVGTRQVSVRASHYPSVPGTERDGLMVSNVAESANDVQIAATYSQSEVATMLNE